MRTVQWNEFWDVCRYGLKATMWLLLLLVIWMGAVHLIAYGINSNSRNVWEVNSHTANVYNAALASFEAGTVQDPRRLFTPTERAYVEFVLALSRARTTVERRTAYAIVSGYSSQETLVVSDPDQITALTDPVISLAWRLRHLPARLEADRVYVAVTEFLEGHHQRRVLPRYPYMYQTRTADGWGLLVFLFCMNYYMAISYLATKSKLWALPANPGGWFLILVYSPAFLFVWTWRGIFHLVLFITTSLHWFFTEADLAKLVAGFAERRRVKPEEVQKRRDEIAKYGPDLVEYHQRLARARDVAEHLQDPHEKADTLARITSAEEDLRVIMQQRRETAESDVMPSASNGEDLDHLVTRIKALRDLKF